MRVEQIQSSKTWKYIFNATATVLFAVAALSCFLEGWSHDGIARMFLLLPLLSSSALLILFLIDGARGLWYLRSTYLAFALGVLVLLSKFMPTESLVVSIGDLNGSVSFIEPLVIFVIFMGSVALQMFLLGNLENGTKLSYVSYAYLGVIGLLLPRMLDSYALVWGCVQKECQEGGSEFASLVPMYNVSFASVSTLCVLALGIYFIVPFLPKLPDFSDKE